jgi:hypothetical protein
MKCLRTLFLIPFIWLTACQPRIPEIAPFADPLAARTLAELAEPAVQILPLKDRLYVLTEGGTLLELPDKRKRLDLGHPVTASAILPPDRMLVLSEGRALLLTISTNEASLQPLSLPPDISLHGAVGRGFVYARKNHLFWYDLKHQRSDPLPGPAEDILGIQEEPDGTVYLIGRQNILFQRTGTTGFLGKIVLPSPIEYHPVIAKNELWAMNADRYLLRYRLYPFSLVWKKRLDHILHMPPVRLHSLLLATTLSSTLLALRPSGSQAWYASLGGLPLCPPSLIDDRIAVVVRVRETVRLLIFDLNGQRIFDHLLGEQPGSPFVFHGETLIFNGRSEGRTNRLVGTSTRFDATPPLSPGDRIPLGKRIPIQMTVTNLLKAEHDLAILNQRDETIWNAHIGPQNLRPPVWTAVSSGEFRLLVETRSQGRPPLTQSIPFTVYDLTQQIRTVRDAFLRSLFPPPKKN